MEREIGVRSRGSEVLNLKEIMWRPWIWTRGPPGLQGSCCSDRTGLGVWVPPSLPQLEPPVNIPGPPTPYPAPDLNSAESTRTRTAPAQLAGYCHVLRPESSSSRDKSRATIRNATRGSVVGLRDSMIGARWRRKLLWPELNATPNPKTARHALRGHWPTMRGWAPSTEGLQRGKTGLQVCPFNRQ